MHGRIGLVSADVPLPVIGMFLTWPGRDVRLSRQRSWGFPFAVLLLPTAFEQQNALGRCATRHPRLPLGWPRPDRFHRGIDLARLQALAQASAAEFVENNAVPTREHRGSPAGLKIKPDRDHSCPSTGPTGP